jgi:hypothetical protein
MANERPHRSSWAGLSLGLPRHDEGGGTGRAASLLARLVVTQSGSAA